MYVSHENFEFGYCLQYKKVPSTSAIYNFEKRLKKIPTQLTQRKWLYKLFFKPCANVRLTKTIIKCNVTVNQNEL